jgi:hypothetical protein
MLIGSLKYLSYTTGSYDSGKYDGITLQFESEITGEHYYVIFNANIRRKRNTKYHKAGSLLPKGRFSVGRRSNFFKFWHLTGLKIPARLSAFNDYMGKLKKFQFAAEVSKGNRLDASTLHPTNTPQTITKQNPNKKQTTTSNNDLNKSKTDNGQGKKLTTYEKNRDISTQVDTVTSNTKHHISKQSNEDWLKEYENEEYF